MLRQVILHLLLVLLPIAVYILYSVLVRQADLKGKIWSDAPWVRMLSIGLALTVAAFALGVTFDGSEPGSVYVPPSSENGKIVPGRFE